MRVILIAIIAAAALPAGASAATVLVKPIPAGEPEIPAGYAAMYYDAEPGEANRLFVRTAPGTITFHDQGAPVQAGEGCTQRGGHTAVCRRPTEFKLAFAAAHLGDRGDRITGDDNVSLHAFGQAGDDVMRDGDPSHGYGYDRFDGGRGTDLVSYRGRTKGLGIDLKLGYGGSKNEEDDLDRFEDAVGGAGSDAILGTAGANHLIGGGGVDLIRSRDGNDRVEGGSGEDYLSCGGGTDRVIEPRPEDHVGSGCEGGVQRKFLSSFMPSGVSTDSGWNWTP
jgi:hypothetical protein